MTIPKISQEELRAILIAGVQSKDLYALVVEGALRFFHPEHTDDEMVSNSLTVEEVKHLMFSDDEVEL